MAEPAKDLHEIAVDAEEALGDLATGLAQEGADGEVIATVRKMKSVCARIVRALGPSAEPTPQQAEPRPQPAQAAHQQEQPQQPQTLDSATRHLHQSMQAAAAARQGGR